MIKQCKVKTNIVKRLHKELGHYQKEEKQEQTRVDKLRADGADKFDLKQAVRFIALHGELIDAGAA